MAYRTTESVRRGFVSTRTGISHMYYLGAAFMCIQPFLIYVFKKLHREQMQRCNKKQLVLLKQKLKQTESELFALRQHYKRMILIAGSKIDPTYEELQLILRSRTPKHEYKI